jgi:hypothetical protein
MIVDTGPGPGASGLVGLGVARTGDGAPRCEINRNATSPAQQKDTTIANASSKNPCRRVIQKTQPEPVAPVNIVESPTDSL